MRQKSGAAIMNVSRRETLLFVRLKRTTNRIHLVASKAVPSRFPTAKLPKCELSTEFSREKFWAATPEERVARCREMAALAAQLAANASSSARTDYLALAQQWRGLADEMDAFSDTPAWQR